MIAPVIELRGVATRFGRLWVHRDLDLTIAAGELVALVGGSGSGKTTLLRAILGLLTPAAGEVRVFGERLSGGGQRRERALRRRFGVLFQHGALFSALTVFDNTSFSFSETVLKISALISLICSCKEVNQS